MTFRPLPLPPGDHDLEGPVLRSDIHSIDGSSGLARIVLTLGSAPTELLRPAHRQATRVAIHVAKDVAEQLARDFALVAKKMDSAPPKGK